MNKRHVLAVLAGGLVAGLLDITFALSFAAYNGTAPIRLLQIVASGLFGKAALSGGVSMAIWGLALHFGMSLLWASAFMAAASVRPSLARRPYVFGCLFGLIVFLAMRLVVLPLSAFPFPVTFKPVASILDLLSHMLLFGIPIVLAVRKSL